ncbi:MAG: hypothetical protein AMXMBFR4_20620 [Candidatus Hydrogenedentota bacterium]
MCSGSRRPIPFPAPSGRGDVATGVAESYGSRTERNPWNQLRFFIPAPAGQRSFSPHPGADVGARGALLCPYRGTLDGADELHGLREAERPRFTRGYRPAPRWGGEEP